MKIVFATNNEHKVNEIVDLLPSSMEVLTLKEIGCFEEIEETENTLLGNARIKTDHVRIKYNYDCFADDTGLEVDALNGEPGVYSARYAGTNASFEDNVSKMLAAMEGVENRQARFRTVISLFLHGKQYFFEGICEGDILTTKKGGKGFGYDPIFKPNGYEQSFAEMDMHTKGLISHRGLAVQKLIKFLNTST